MKIFQKPKIRIFMGFNEVSGYYSNLSYGFSEVGIEHYFVNYFPNQFAFDSKNKMNFLVKTILYFRKKLNISNLSKFKKTFFHIGLLGSVCCLLLWAIIFYDVFIFGFRTSFFSIVSSRYLFKELPILKKIGKKIIFVFHGSDSRPPYLNGAYGDYDGELLVRMSLQFKSEISYIEKYADCIINHQPTSQFHTKKIINWLIIGIPFDGSMVSLENRIENNNYNPFSKKPTILHCPSRLKEKGTFYIRQILKELEVEGYYFNYIEISGRPNIEVINALQQSDFVIDELYSDTPMAGFATEAAWYAKPTIVTGFEIEKVISNLKPQEIPPTLWGRPDQIKDLIILLLKDVNYRIDLGKRACEFVKLNWSSKHVAGRFLKLINNQFPSSWYFDPLSLDYCYGWGMDLDLRCQMLRKMYTTDGLDAFQVSDKQALKDNFLNIITNAEHTLI